jgi:hypothetical protein
MNLTERSHPKAKVIVRMPCSALPKLIKQYRFATARLFDCVEQLSPVAYLDDGTFERGWSACEEARAHCVQIQDRIYQHLQEHRCALEVSRMAPCLGRALTAKPGSIA